MAIHSLEKVQNKNKTKLSFPKSSNISSTKLIKIDCEAIDDISIKNSDYDSKENRSISPYLSGDRFQFLSRITEKKLIHKRTADFMSSFPLAVNIYKANSDQIRLPKRRIKKVKKSVLTLPNEPAPVPQTCTVSDMNDSESFNGNEDGNVNKSKKRLPIKKRKPMQYREIKVYDRDAKYCSQFNTALDKSTEMINTGDWKKVSKTFHPQMKNRNISNKSELNAHDVWSMLRNVNKFQLTPSISQDSYISVKKRKNLRRRQNTQRDTKFIETCRTEEFAYISSFIDHPLQNANSQSSIDRITVIDKQDDIHEINKHMNNELKNRKSQLSWIEKNLSQNNKVKSKKKVRKQNDEIFEKEKCDRMINEDNTESEKTSKEYLSIEGRITKKVKPINLPICSNKIIHKNSNDNISEFSAERNNEKNLISSNHSDLVSGEGSINNFKNVTQVQNVFQDSTVKEPQQVTGITKVVLSKGQKILQAKQLEAVKRRSVCTTTLLNSSITPKLTQTEIKKRLASLRFPLVILDKNQVSSTIEVNNYNPPQFDGLDEHIWPFMKNWLHKDKYDFFENDFKEENIVIKCSNFKDNKSINVTHNNQNKSPMKININKSKSILGEKKIDNISMNMKKKNNIQPLFNQKVKPMQKVKDKMMQFIHKKSECKSSLKSNVNTNSYTEKTRVSPRGIVDVSTNTQNDVILHKTSIELEKEKNVKRNTLNKSYQWAKRKWASDFIDNVIKKIRNGVYFYQDDKNLLRKPIHKTEESAQTKIIVNSSFDHDSQVTTINASAVTSIPGFDNRLTDLEIETVKNFNQISVKHCVTNIVIQFDVALSRELNCVQIKKPFSYSSLKETEDPKIFKCKTTIINAILPAEICSILPNLLQKVIGTNSKLRLPISAIDEVESHLPSITEIIRCESRTMKQIDEITINISPETNTPQRGKFSGIVSAIIPKCKVKEYVKRSPNQTSDLADVQWILSKINIPLLSSDIKKCSPITSHFICLLKPISQHDDFKNIQKVQTCMALQPYVVSNKRVFPTFAKLNFLSLVKSILSHKFLNINVNSPFVNSFKVVFYNNNKVTLTAEADDIDIIGKTTYTITNLSTDSLYNESIERNDENNVIPKFNERNIIEANEKVTDKRKIRAEFSVNFYRNKKRGFIKLYKKCKSLSSLANERSSTALDKITNLDEFFIAMGSTKTLSSVLDGNIERKILSSINEMKNWMIAITPRQALLVLLLANKKDTSSLVRYRPIILQGIAVNRITRATEMDMEIEVIETEKVNVRSRCEGITYLPASVENQDSLFEELCWIAKTTASDYQKTFDDSSERHLKSLLEKRKKLNPSYLRVMARYVGLGLLKSSK